MEPNLTLILSALLLLAGSNLAVSFMLLFRDKSGYRAWMSGVQRMNEWIERENRNNRNEIFQYQKNLMDILAKKMDEYGESNRNQLMSFQNQLHQLMQSADQRMKDLGQQTNTSLIEVRRDVSAHLTRMQTDNQVQLEKMRLTVDEKLHKTLENRLGQSFRLVNDSLEKVQKGLGEMQSLANGVGDLKKVLSNVKTRGVLGEIQLGNILEQILSPHQYDLNVMTRPDSRCHVEFAIKLPGKDHEEKQVWLPIDSKFPMDVFETLLAAYEGGCPQEIQAASKTLVSTVKKMAGDIRTKYIAPPYTTDFGILFLPTEGLYAEVVRQPGLMEELQRDFRIMLAGPTNLAAFLNSLQMGFQTLAIEKRSSEVWNILSAVKTEFSKFGDVLARTQKKLHEASSVIDQAGVRSRAIERKLRDVEAAPALTAEGISPELGKGLM